MDGTSSSHELAAAFLAGRTHLQTPADLRFRVIDSEALVLRQDAAEVLGLNPVGTRILQAIAEGALAGEIMTKLEGEFEVDREALLEDVQSFLAELIENGLLNRVPETEP